MAKSYGSSSGHPLAEAMKTIADNTKETADALKRIATLTQRAAVSAAGNTGGGGGSGGGLGGGGSGGLAAEQAKRDEAYRQHKAKIASENAKEAREAPQRAFQIQQADRFRTAGNLNTLGMGGVGNPMASMTAKAGAMHEMGIPGAGMLSRFAGPAGAVIAGVQAGADINNIRADAYATDAQKSRAFMKSGWVPLGETGMGIADKYNAREANMTLVQHGLANLGAESQRDVALQAHSLSYNPAQAGREGLASAYARGSAVTAGVFDRGTVTGQTSADDARRLLPYRQATAKAERDMLSTTAQRVAAEKELGKLQSRETQLLKEQVGIQKALDRGGSGPEREVVVGQAAQNATQLQRINEQIREASQGVTSSRSSESQAKGEYAKASIREDKLGQADKLRDRAQRSEASASRLGGMLPGQAEMGDALVDQLKANPEMLKYLPPDQLDLARAVDPDAVDSIQKNLGANSAVFAKKQAEGNRNYAGNYAELGRQADVLEGEAAKGEYKSDTKVASEIAQSGRELGVFIAKSISEFAEQVKKEIATRFLKGKD